MAAVLALTLAAAVVRFHGLGAHGLWCDEFVSLSSATGGTLVTPISPGTPTFTSADFWREDTLGGLSRAVARQDVGNGVLHAVALHYWVAAFGTSDVAVRTLSVLAGIGVVLLTWSLARSLLTEDVALLAAALAALHPMLVRYSRETRAYALAMLLALAATCLFVRLWRVAADSRPSRLPARGLAYGLFVGAALLAHYLVAAIFAGHALFALLRVREARVWKSLAAGWALAAVMVAAWMGAGGAEGLRVGAVTNQRLREQAEPSTRRARPLTVGNVGRGLAGVAAQWAGIDVERHPNPSPARLALTLIAGGLVALAFVDRREAGAPALLLAILSVAGAAQAAAWAVSVGHTAPLNPRYTIFSVPYLLVLMAEGLSAGGSQRGIRRALPVVAGAVLAVAWMGSLRDVWADAPLSRPPNPHAESAARLDERLQPGDEVVHGDWQSARLWALYLAPREDVVQRVEPQAAAPLRVWRNGQTVFEEDLPRACPMGMIDPSLRTPRRPAAVP